MDALKVARIGRRERLAVVRGTEPRKKQRRAVNVLLEIFDGFPHSATAHEKSMKSLGADLSFEIIDHILAKERVWEEQRAQLGLRNPLSVKSG